MGKMTGGLRCVALVRVVYEKLERRRKRITRRETKQAIYAGVINDGHLKCEAN